MQLAHSYPHRMIQVLYLDNLAFAIGRLYIMVAFRLHIVCLLYIYIVDAPLS